MSDTDLIERLRVLTNDLVRASERCGREGDEWGPTPIEAQAALGNARKQLDAAIVAALESRPAGAAVRKLAEIEKLLPDDNLRMIPLDRAFARLRDIRAILAANPLPSPEIEAPAVTVNEGFCECFGDSGIYASTHATEGSPYRHCDLCGRPIKGTEEPPAAGEAESLKGYYAEGKDAEWFERLNDKTFARQCSNAAMDIVDGNFSDVEDWLPITAILSSAADRIERLTVALTGQPETGEGAVPLFMAEYCGHLKPRFTAEREDDVKSAVMLMFTAHDGWEKAERHGWRVVKVAAIRSRSDDAPASDGGAS